jgi:polysaccharide deacetylase family protein (PEP-CTERM system associated)
MRPSSTDNPADGSAAGRVRLGALPGDGSLPTAPFDLSRPWRPSEGAPMPNALTCDVEDYFQVSAFASLIPQARWNELECRLPGNVDRALQLLSDAGAKGTFFTLGWVAERFPAVVKRIADEGHEIASHGMRHVRVWMQSPDEFRQDVVRAKRLLEDTSGAPVRGYRAASWSIDTRTPWAHGLLREAGYEYSSSIYPIAHDTYGMPDAPTEPFYVGAADMLEVPATTPPVVGPDGPALAVSLWLLGRVERARRVPAVFYFHPWELDPDQPRIPGAGRRARFRHYLNLHKMEERLKVLLRSFEWDRMDRIFCGAASDAGRRARA